MESRCEIIANNILKINPFYLGMTIGNVAVICLVIWFFVL
ncbi:hypothetical protein VCSRO91_2818 [Vibrio cholerae]|nr:hypothetical protein VCSRO91_2818 [Vibrio cholerae]